jgi:arsenite oxidase small subunit
MTSNHSSKESTLDKEPISRNGFIRLAAMLGASSAMASVLSACGGGGQSGGSSSGGQSTQASGGEQSTTTQAAGPSVGKGEAIAQQPEVPANSAVAFTNSDLGQPGVLVHLQSGDFVAYSAVCTHKGCTVSYQPQTQQITCPCHGSIFDPAQDASVVQGPATTPLPKLDIAQQNGEVLLT